MRPIRLAGFSLIEVVLAIGLASFALVAILGGYSVGLQTASVSQHQTKAYQLAKSTFAVLQAGPFREAKFYGNVLDLSQPMKAPLELQVGGTLPEDNGEYRIQLQYYPIIGEDGRVAGSQVSLAIVAMGQPERSYRYVSVVGNY